MFVNYTKLFAVLSFKNIYGTHVNPEFIEKHSLSARFIFMMTTAFGETCFAQLQDLVCLSCYALLVAKPTLPGSVGIDRRIDTHARLW